MVAAAFLPSRFKPGMPLAGIAGSSLGGSEAPAEQRMNAADASIASVSFEAFGEQAFIREEPYRKHQKVLDDPSSGIQVPYRMKIIDRDMTPEDFSALACLKNCREPGMRPVPA